jgi:predicted nucleic acid-binding protein
LKLVIDANILFSAIIKDGITRRLILDDRLQLFSPDFILDEYKKHFQLLVKKSGLNEIDVHRLSIILLSKVKLIDFSELVHYKDASRHLTIDPDDEPYIACALAIGADIWSRDKHLKQPRVKCWSTEELVKKLLSRD